MKVALCAAQIPFMQGGAEFLCDNLYRALAERGHEVEYVKIPFKWYPPEEIINSSLAWRLLDLSESHRGKIDGVIATKFPSYAVKHKCKVIWLLHQHRSAYDLAGTPFDNLAPYGHSGEIVRKKIHSMDRRFFHEARDVSTISQNVADRLQRYNSIHGNVLYPPPPLMGWKLHRRPSYFLCSP